MSQAIEALAHRNRCSDRSIEGVDRERNRKNGPCAARAPSVAKIFVVDDDYFSRDGICGLIQDAGWEAEAFPSCEDFLAAYQSIPNTCLVLDIHLPGRGGLELLNRLSELAHSFPVIAISGCSGISEAVQSMRQGALDFIEKPVPRERLIASVTRALARSRRTDTVSALREAALGHLTGLTKRQHEILDRILDGQPSKNIATDLGISQRTVENHRAAIMRRTGARSLPALAQKVMCTHCVADNKTYPGLTRSLGGSVRLVSPSPTRKQTEGLSPTHRQSPTLS